MRAQLQSPPIKHATQVTLATLLVAGTPVAAVWWMRASGTVDSAAITLLIGMALSLLISWVGRVVWEKHQGSDDLLFSELMIWGYIHRCRTQRRLSSAAELVAGLSAPAGTADARAVRAQTRLLEGLVSGMETRDPYLHGHSRRVARYSWMIARHMKLGPEQAAHVRAAAAIHDVGKTKTPKTILHKAGPLTDEEYRIIKLHPGEGAEMASVLGDAELTAMVRYHHERLDGSGYPDGLRGDQIPLGARIIAVADTFDAITSARPYRDPSPHRKAIDILRAEAGTKLDPEVVRAFCGHYAGRGPLALWSFVCSLPERMVSWLSASAGAVASAAKVAAVAALVGGVAATSATLGVTGGNHLHARHAGARDVAVTRSGGPAGADVISVGDASSGAQHASQAPRRRRGGAKRAPAPGTHPALASPYVAAPRAAGDSQHALAGQEASGTGHHDEAGGGAGGEERAHGESPRPVQSEPPSKGKHEEAPAKSKHEEAPAKSKSEEAPAKGKSEEASGKSEESPGHSKPEETPPPEEASNKGSSGKEGSGKGSSGKGSDGESGSSGKGSSGGSH